MTAISPYTVEAYNTAKESENKMHDDAVARRFGFSGGLVPGVDVYAYMTHPPVERWGRAFLERGTLVCRLVKPVYDGEPTTVSAREGPDGIELTVTSRGEICATGLASLAKEPSSLPDWETHAAAEPRATRPPASAASLEVGAWLGTRPFATPPAWAASYLVDVRETAQIYAAEGLVHPGQLLRVMNWALSHNVVLGPWIHVGSTVRHLAAAAIGRDLTARAKITGNYERKGHRFVELDGLVLSAGTPVARVLHTAIYEPRQAAAA